MAGGEKGHGFVAELRIAHAGAIAVGVAGAEEKGKEIVLIGWTSAALGDHLIDGGKDA